MSATKVRPFLMFEGQAEEAMRFYMSLLPGSTVVFMDRYGKGEPGPEGPVRKAEVVLGDQTVLCSDSYVKHGFTFTPSISLFVDCDSEDMLRRLAASLSAGGSELMPIDNYGFSRLFAWVSDRYGVSWQLNLA